MDKRVLGVLLSVTLVFGTTHLFGRDNHALVAAGNRAALAKELDVDADVLRETLDRWNAACDRGNDRDHGRPPTSMMKIVKPPFYFAEVWPLCQNTHGGPPPMARWASAMTAAAKRPMAISRYS